MTLHFRIMTAAGQRQRRVRGESGRADGRAGANVKIGRRAADTLFDLQHFGGEIKDVDVIGIAVVKVP